MIGVFRRYRTLFVRSLPCLFTFLLFNCTHGVKSNASSKDDMLEEPQIRGMSFRPSLNKKPRTPRKAAYNLTVEHSSGLSFMELAFCENKISSATRRCSPSLKKPLKIVGTSPKSIKVPIKDRRVRVYMRACNAAKLKAKSESQKSVCSVWSYEIVNLLPNPDGGLSTIQVGFGN